MCFAPHAFELRDGEKAFAVECTDERHVRLGKAQSGPKASKELAGLLPD
jgi:hypothetical protein